MRKESDLLLAKNQLNKMETTIISLSHTRVGNDTQHMTSLEIAQVTGKQHKNLMQAIRNMESAWEKTCGSNFRLTSRTIVQPNGGTRAAASPLDDVGRGDSGMWNG